MMGRSRVRRLRAVQGKCDNDVDSNESYERMPLGANERASERVWLFWCWVNRNLWGGAAIARARPLHLLRDRFARSLRVLLLTRFRHKASAIGARKMGVRRWMNGWKRRHGGARSFIRFGDGALSTSSTRARCGVLCITATAFLVSLCVFYEGPPVVRWRPFGDAMMNGGQVTRARVLIRLGHGHRAPQDAHGVSTGP